VTFVSGALWLAVLGAAAPAPFTLGTWPTMQSEKLRSNDGARA
jgi:hypothetical protein